MTSEVMLSKLGFISIFPEMVSAITDWGVTGRAVRDGRCSIEVIDPRVFATDRHGTVDDRPYGGGPGMVMTAPIMTAAVESAKNLLGDQAPRSEEHTSELQSPS